MPDVQRTLQWPRELWSPEEQQAIIEHRKTLHREMFQLASTAEREDRNLTPDERDRYQALQTEFNQLA